MSDLGKLMRQNGNPRFCFGIRGRFRRVGEHLPPCLPFGIGVARRGLAEGAEVVALFPGGGFCGVRVRASDKKFETLTKTPKKYIFLYSQSGID
jgi:hypothetical protein